MRVCLLSLLHCFPTLACPSCSLALILPAAAVRLYASLRGSSQPALPGASTSRPSSGLCLVASGLVPRNLPQPPASSRSHQPDLRKNLGATGDGILQKGVGRQHPREIWGLWTEF